MSMRTLFGTLFGFIVLLCCGPVQASSNLQYRLLTSQQQLDASLWQAQQQRQITIVNTLDWQQQQQFDGSQLQLAGTFWHRRSFNNTDATNTDTRNSQLQFSEAWWGLDLGDWSLSVGKRKRDFDVNHALRPLDLFSPTDTLALYTLVAPGVWQLAADWFGDNNALTLLCNETKQTFSRQGQQLPASWGCGGRYHHQQGAFEWQALLHQDADIGTRAGGSLLQVLTDAMAFQMSVLWQQRSWQSQWIDWPTPALGERPLVQALGGRSGWQLSAGLNYTFASGYNLLLEYGYDGQAPTNQTWQALRQQLADAQAQAKPIQGVALQSSRQLLAGARLSQQQWLLHLRSDGNGRWQHTLTLLRQPAVRGLLMSASLSYSTGHHSSFNLGIKHFAGASDSAYALLGLRSELVAGVSYVF